METNKKVAASLPPVPLSTPPLGPDGCNNALAQVRSVHGRTTGPARRSTRGQWTPEEDEILRNAVHRHKGKNWKKIAECFPDRTDVQCLHRWQKVLNPELVKGPWSKEEDEIIVQLVNKYGPKKWSTIAQHLPGRIGKQCRERWHNHLNPCINKEAWTQEEELILIRAHQIHGNRWAELTKYLPGRSDNSIKNHWNSSVKKKLDSYIASGLLAQFQGFPLVSHQNESIPGASLHANHINRDDCISKDRTEMEENSECSQVGCSQTASDMSNSACQTKDELVQSQESDHGKGRTTSPTRSFSEQYYPSLDDIAFTIADVPCELSCSTNNLNENFENPVNYGAINIPDVGSMDLVVDSTNISSEGYLLVNANHEIVDGRSFTVDMQEGSGQGTLPEKGVAGCSSLAYSASFSDIADMDRYRNSLGLQSSFQVSGTGNIALQSYNSLNGTEGEASLDQNVSSLPSEVTKANDLSICAKELNHIDYNFAASRIQEVANTEKELTRTNNDSDATPCRDHIDVGMLEGSDLDASKLVPASTFSSEMSEIQETRPVVGPVGPTGQQETRNLCYEPPRFPSLDIPFFSCDLAQSATEVQQDFSPLGIRKLMMSSMNSLTPFKLWDSPTRDDSPDAMLKSAAKTFACTPSILKKRHRDLLSPLSPFSERRLDKKTGNDVNQGFVCTSRLTKEFSRLDVMFNEVDDGKESSLSCYNQDNQTKVFIEDKENICPEKLSEEVESSDFRDKNSDEKDGEEETEQNRGILIECQLNETQFSSPNGIRSTKQGTPELGDDSKTGSGLKPCSLGQKKDTRDSLVSSVVVDSLVNEVGAENLNFFGGTPFRRSIESPSAWKSPWYFNSLVPCLRFDTDITVEDIGIFMSPGERGVDALGLMKQINEQNADAYADARKVLGSDTPESILRKRCSRSRDPNTETDTVGNSRLEDRPHLSAKVSTEPRVLDFSECGSPAKSTEKGKCAVATSVSSPSALLKSYR